MPIDKTSRPRNIAVAFELIAGIDHYMVGFIGPATLEELELARQILIVRESINSSQVVRKALDLVEQEIKGHRF